MYPAAPRGGSDATRNAQAQHHTHPNTPPPRRPPVPGRARGAGLCARQDGRHAGPLDRWGAGLFQAWGWCLCTPSEGVVWCGAVWCVELPLELPCVLGSLCRGGTKPAALLSGNVARCRQSSRRAYGSGGPLQRHRHPLRDWRADAPRTTAGHAGARAPVPMPLACPPPKRALSGHSMGGMLGCGLLSQGDSSKYSEALRWGASGDGGAA